MSIRSKNITDVADRLHQHGTQSVSADIDSTIAPFTGIIAAIFARLRVAGVTGSQVTDIQKNGVSIFSSGGLTYGATVVPTYGTLTQNPTKVVKGDQIALTTTSVHTTPGKSQVVWLVYRRARASRSNDATEFDTFGSENDAL